MTLVLIRFTDLVFLVFLVNCCCRCLSFLLFLSGTIARVSEQNICCKHERIHHYGHHFFQRCGHSIFTIYLHFAQVIWSVVFCSVVFSSNLFLPPSLFCSAQPLTNVCRHTMNSTLLFNGQYIPNKYYRLMRDVIAPGALKDGEEPLPEQEDEEGVMKNIFCPYASLSLKLGRDSTLVSCLFPSMKTQPCVCVLMFFFFLYAPSKLR